MFKKIDENYILTIDEACEQLKIEKNGLYQLMRSNQLKAFKIGLNWKIPYKSILDYISNHLST